MLCSICHERPAAVHITTIVDRLEQRQDLCETCASASEAEFHAWAKKMVGKTCDYCGSAPTAGLAPGGRRAWCQKCADQFARIFQQVHAEPPRPTDMARLPPGRSKCLLRPNGECEHRAVRAGDPDTPQSQRTTSGTNYAA